MFQTYSMVETSGSCANQSRIGTGLFYVDDLLYIIKDNKANLP